MEIGKETLMMKIQSMPGCFSNKAIKLVCLSLTILIMSGCQLVSSPINSTSSYGQYYLWLKGLTAEELKQEVSRQKQSQSMGNVQAKEFLLLLHSLPNSPVYNAYTAKSILNELHSQQIEAQYVPKNLALMTLLKDQLNQQLFALEKLKNKSALLVSRQNEIQQVKQSSEQQALLIKQLKQQITQLKKIEKNINEHGN